MTTTRAASAAGFFALTAFAGAQLLHRGTQVTLCFDQDLSSKTARVGDTVLMHVTRDVVVDGSVVIPAGTREDALVAAVHKRGRFGKNASIRLVLNPVKGPHDTPVPLQSRSAGKDFKGSRTDHAALVAGAGLIVLGPLGVAGGWFIPGKDINVKQGDKLESEIAHDVRT